MLKGPNSEISTCLNLPIQKCPIKYQKNRIENSFNKFSPLSSITLAEESDAFSNLNERNDLILSDEESFHLNDEKFTLEFPNSEPFEDEDVYTSEPVEKKKQFPLRAIYNEHTNTKQSVKCPFIVLKPGRKKKDSEYDAKMNAHSKFKKDNIFRKIKVKFQDFIIDFTNKIIKFEFPIQFPFLKMRKGLSHITKEISIKFNRGLFQQTIQEILVKGNSIKFKRENNSKNVQKIIQKKNKAINKFLYMKYIDVYKNLFIGASAEAFPEYKGLLEESKYFAKCLDELKNEYGESDEYIKIFKESALTKFEEYFLHTRPRRSKTKFLRKKA